MPDPAPKSKFRQLWDAAATLLLILLAFSGVIFLGNSCRALKNLEATSRKCVCPYCKKPIKITVEPDEKERKK